MIGDTIVVVEDEPEVLGILRAILEDEGYQVVTVADPAVIDLSMAGRQPCLFLIDIMLPTMSGIDLAADLHLAGHASTPMIAMSASRLMVRRAADSGWFIGTLEKPFDLDSLVERVEQHLLVG